MSPISSFEMLSNSDVSKNIYRRNVRLSRLQFTIQLSPFSNFAITVCTVFMSTRGLIGECAKDGGEECFTNMHCARIDDCAKDGGEEFFTEMHCVL